MTLHNKKSECRDVPMCVIIPTTLVWVLFGTTIPTSPFNFYSAVFTLAKARLREPVVL